jgi:hypothetical protein
MIPLHDISRSLRTHMSAIIAVAIMALLLFAYLAFIILRMAPDWQRGIELKAQLARVQATLAAKNTPTFSDLNGILSEAEAAEFLTRLSHYAEQHGVTLLDVDPQTAVSEAEKSDFDRRLFRFIAEGDVSQLLNFVGGIRETAVPGVQLKNLQINAGGESLPGSLIMDVVLITSPYAPGNTLATLPEPLATPVPPTPYPTPNAAELAQRLHEPWTAEKWPDVIALIQVIIKLDPAYPEMKEKLYAAYVNYGYQLATNGQPEAARSQFELALTIRPDGVEALDGLRSLVNPASTP